MKFSIITLIILLLNTRCSTGQECYFDGDDFCVSQEDILSVDLLPGTFFLSDPYKNITEKKNNDKIIANGTYEEAFNEMDYHRKRMNEYLCHGFIAEEIFRDMRSIRVKRRQDEYDDISTNSIPDFLGDDNVTVHDKLLTDEGSSKYKEWLQRTTTLDDVYRHYKYNAAAKKMRKKYGQSPFEGMEEFDGEVTGYAVPAPVSHEKTEHFYDEDLESSPTGYHFNHHPHASHHYTAPHYPSHEDVLPVVHEEYHYHAPLHEEEEEHKPIHKKGDLSIKDFFEIALTALAFLAFGCFIIQLLMAMNSSSSTVATEIVNRFKREKINASPYRSNAELNELAHRVLQSIEAIMVADSDSGRCLHWTLCRDNQYSVQINGPQKFWIPLWSLGMSWLSSRAIKGDNWSSMFNSMRAAVLGLGGANCATVYSGCDLLDERIKRRRRRRRRKK